MNVSDGGVLTKASETTDLEVLADGHDLLGHGLSNCKLAVGVLALHECVNVCRVVLQDNLADILNESDEKIALCAEVGLAVDFNNCADAALGANGCVCHAFRCNAAGLLCCLCKALFTKIFNGLVHIAVALGQCLFAVHHADAGHLTESFYVLCCKCHNFFLLYYLRKGAGCAP